MIELASETETQNGKSLVACGKYSVPNVKLDKNAEISESIIVKGNNTKLNLNNNTLSSDTIQENIIKVESDKALTVTNGKIEVEKQEPITNTENNKWAIRNEGTLTLENVNITSDFGIVTNNNLIIKGNESNKSKIDIAETAIAALNNNAKVDIDSVEIESDKCALSTNGQYTEIKININNSKLTQINNDKSCVYLPASGEAIFTDCEISGGSAIETRGSSVTINGGKLYGKEKTHTSNPENGNGSYSNGSALLIISRKGYNDNQKINIKVSEATEINKVAEGASEIEIYQSTEGAGVNGINIYSGKYEVKLNNVTSASGVAQQTKFDFEV